MAQFKIIKTVDFGPYTILGPSGLQSDQVPINNYAPKVGETIEGTLETKPVNDGNGHTEIKTGVTWRIRTAGASSSTGQSSDQFITSDHFEQAVIPDGGNGGQPSPNPQNPPAQDGGGASTDKGCWMCKNSGAILVGLVLILFLAIIFKD